MHSCNRQHEMYGEEPERILRGGMETPSTRALQNMRGGNECMGELAGGGEHVVFVNAVKGSKGCARCDLGGVGLCNRCQVKNFPRRSTSSGIPRCSSVHVLSRLAAYRTGLASPRETRH